eukprot:10940909-Alexandrium_andersonii.AAC.1
MKPCRMEMLRPFPGPCRSSSERLKQCLIVWQGGGQNNFSVAQPNVSLLGINAGTPLLFYRCHSAIPADSQWPTGQGTSSHYTLKRALQPPPLNLLDQLNSAREHVRVAVCQGQ